MQYRERKRSRRSLATRPAACLVTALSAILAQHQASATTTKTGPDPVGTVVWCLGDGTTHPAIPNYPADTSPPNTGVSTNPADTWDSWGSNPLLTNWWPTTNVGLGNTAETPAPAAPNQNDRYAIQLNYWNSVANSTSLNPNAPFGYSPGQSCLSMPTKDYLSPIVGQFTITYPASPSKPRAAEQAWAQANPNSYPWYGKAPFTDGPTQGAPTGYVSTFKGCSWDANSCTQGSSIPTAPNPDTSANTDPNVFPKKLSTVTSIPTEWKISYNTQFGKPDGSDGTQQAWDASYDIWFDTTADTSHGISPYSATGARGQNDGLEIMVWMNHKGSYVDGPTLDGAGMPAENQTGFIQPTGHIRERVVINGVLYDVWVGRLGNAYFGHIGDPTVPVTAEGKTTPTAEPYTCAAAPNGPCGVLGTQWNVVSFVATKAGGVDNRKMSMSMDAKVFADYILGIQDGLWEVRQTIADNGATWAAGDASAPAGTFRTANQVLQCPNSAANRFLSDPKANCLDLSWYLMSIQAGFETWIGGNGLQSDVFKAHAYSTSTGIQTGLIAGDGRPIIHWTTPFDVIYSGCSAYSASNQAYFYISGNLNGDPATPGNYPAGAIDGNTATYQNMGAQDPNTKQFVFTVQAMFPIHGDAVIHFASSCGASLNVPVFIDPSGKIFYSDGKTPLQGATVTLQRSSSETPFGPFVAVPDGNGGLSSPVMQPDDNVRNSMFSTSIGSYGWNVIPGWYRVSASYPGCGTVTTAAKQVTPTQAIVNLNINLPCAAPVLPPAVSAPPPPPDGVTPGVSVKLTDNGTQGYPRYCKNVVVTNNNNYPVTWKVKFDLPYPGYIDPVASGHWNFNFTAAGKTITAWGVDWNKTLAAKATSNSIGFCAFKQ